MTLSATLESALIGQASKQDVIEAIDAELARNVTVLVSKAYKAAYSVQPVMSKLPKPFKDFPICATLRLETKEGKLHMTGIHFDAEKECLTAKTESIPARIEAEFSTCVPAKQFTNWLKASQLTTEEKRKGVSEQVNFTFDPKIQILTITAGNSRAVFKCIDSAEFPAV